MGPSAPDSPVELTVARVGTDRLGACGGAERAGGVLVEVLVWSSLVASYVPAPAGRYALEESVLAAATSTECGRDEPVEELCGAL